MPKDFQRFWIFFGQQAQVSVFFQRPSQIDKISIGTFS
jgi:hypothetical protein